MYFVVIGCLKVSQTLPAIGYEDPREVCVIFSFHLKFWEDFRNGR